MEETTKNAWFHKQSNEKKKKKSYFNGFFPATLDSKNMAIIKQHHEMDMYT